MFFDVSLLTLILILIIDLCVYMFYVTRDSKLPLIFNLIFYVFSFFAILQPKSLQYREILKCREFVLLFRNKFFAFFLLLSYFWLNFKRICWYFYAWICFTVSGTLQKAFINFRFPKQADFAWQGFINKRDRFNYSFINCVDFF